MPLLTPTLIDALIKMDEPEPPQTPEETAEAWFKAWWAYAQQMSYWNPATLTLVGQAVYPAFIGALLPGCIPNPIPGTLYLAFELANIAAWVAGSAIPLSLLPAYAPVPLIPPPVPGALTLALVATVPVGLASPSKEPVRIAMGIAIDLWTHLFMATPVAGPPPIPIV